MTELDFELEQATRHHRLDAIDLIRTQSFGEALSAFESLVAMTGATGDLRWRALANVLCGNFADALLDLHSVLAAEPNCVFSQLALAFLFATSPDDRFRNGHLAVRHAKLGLRLTKEPTWRTFSVLAAAYAEDGEFEHAIDFAEKMLDACPHHFRETAKRRIADYSLGLTYTASVAELRESMGFLEYECSLCGDRTFIVWMGEDTAVERLCSHCANEA